MNLKEMIGSMIRDEIQRTVGEMLSDAVVETATEPVEQIEADPAATSANAYRRTLDRINRRGRVSNSKPRPGRVSKQYVLMPVPTSKRGQTAHADAVAGLPPSYRAVYDAMRKARKPLTIHQIIDASGAVPKTVESALYQMRVSTPAIAKSEPIRAAK